MLSGEEIFPMNFSTVKLWLLCVVSLLLASAASAQISRGTITGRITDPTGAVVPGAKIVAVDVATGSSYRTVSTNDGQYTIPFLAPEYLSSNGETPQDSRTLSTRMWWWRQMNVSEWIHHLR